MSEHSEVVDEYLHLRIEHNMSNHAPINDEVVQRFEALRVFAKEFSHAIVDLCPDGRDRTLALTHAEDALMRAVAAIARNQEAVVTAQLSPRSDVPFESSEALERTATESLGEREYQHKAEDVD